MPTPTTTIGYLRGCSSHRFAPTNVSVGDRETDPKTSHLNNWLNKTHSNRTHGIRRTLEHDTSPFSDQFRAGVPDQSRTNWPTNSEGNRSRLHVNAVCPIVRGNPTTSKHSLRIPIPTARPIPRTIGRGRQTTAPSRSNNCPIRRGDHVPHRTELIEA